MRISDWNSDVCSSDLVLSADGNTIEYTFTVTNTGNVTMENITLAEADFSGTATAPVPAFVSNSGTSARKSAVTGQSLSARVDLGSRRELKNHTDILLLFIHHLN